MGRKLFYLSLSLVLILYYFHPNEDMDQEVMIILLFLVVVSTVLFFTKRDKERAIRGQFIKHSTLAVIGLLIVCFQYYFDYVFANIAATNSFIFVNPSIVVKSLTLSFIGLLFFYIGYSAYSRSKYVGTVVKKAFHTRYLEGLVIIFFILFLFTVNINYVMGGYGTVDQGAGVTYIDLLFKIFVISVILQKSRNLLVLGRHDINFSKYFKYLGIKFNISLILYLFLVLISGDRGPLITYSLFVLSGFLFVTKRKIKMRYGIFLLFSGASVMAILGVARQFDSSLSLTEKVQLALQDNPIKREPSFLPQTQELAGSVKTIHHAVDYVPDQHGYLYGRFQFQQLTVALPSFHTFNSVIFDDVSKKYAGSASFVTWIFQGDFPTYGNGTSVIADFYLDFGLLGVIIGMFLFGYFMRFAEIKMYVDNLPGLFSSSFFMVYIGSALYISRSSFLFEFRTVVWVVLVLLINQYLVNRNRIVN